MPEGAVYVGRPSRWGNPFGVTDWFVYGTFVDGYTDWDIDYLTPEAARAASVDMFSDLVRGFFDPTKFDTLSDAKFRLMYEQRTQWITRIGGHPTEMARHELRGKDLVCWCPLISRGEYVPCHSDVLLSVANDLSIDEVVRENHRRAAWEALR